MFFLASLTPELSCWRSRTRRIAAVAGRRCSARGCVRRHREQSGREFRLDPSTPAALFPLCRRAHAAAKQAERDAKEEIERAREALSNPGGEGAAAAAAAGAEGDGAAATPPPVARRMTSAEAREAARAAEDKARNGPLPLSRPPLLPTPSPPTASPV